MVNIIIEISSKNIKPRINLNHNLYNCFCLSRGLQNYFLVAVMLKMEVADCSVLLYPQCAQYR